MLLNCNLNVCLVLIIGTLLPSNKSFTSSILSPKAHTPIIKTKKTFKLQLSNITDVFSQNYEECKDPSALDYKDYLRILLLINNQKNNVLRSMDLIEANLSLSDEHKNFKMDFCVEFIDLDIHFFIGKDIKYNKKFGYIQ